MLAPDNVRVEEDVWMRTRDGTRLSADVYRPAAEGSFPVILMRSPYDRRTALTISGFAPPKWYARQGYIVVLQDTRGRGASEGVFQPFEYEASDGYDAVEWAARLPGSTGKVGMYGFSYVGATQMLAAVMRPPSLRCICPGFTSSQYHEGWIYRGGAFSLAFGLSWSVGLAQDTARRRGLEGLERELRQALLQPAALYEHMPLRDLPALTGHDLAPYYREWLEHEARDAYWERWSLESRYHNVDVPALHIAGWYDIFLDGTIRNFLGIRRDGTASARSRQRLLVTPWAHTPWGPAVGCMDFGAQAENRIDDLQLRWFDRWLKNRPNGVDEEPPVDLFVMGENAWRRSHAWPVPGTQHVDCYLHSHGRANSRYGDGRLDQTPPADEAPDYFTYNPRIPVVSLGGRSCCNPVVTPMGPADQRPVEASGSVLVYTSHPLSEPLEVTGPVTAELWAATSAVDTDWTMKLVDVHPDGAAINVADGIVRAKFRESRLEPRLLEPNAVLRYDIDLGATSNLFEAGHCIRVEVASSNFPTYDRNPNTGRPLGVDAISSAVTARQTVFHDAARPSRIRLPIVPR